MKANFAGLKLVMDLHANSSARDEMFRNNVLRTVSDMIEIALTTGTSALVLIADKFAGNQEALDIIDSMIE